MTVFFVLFGIKVCFPLSWILNDCQTMFLFVSADPYFYWWHSFSLKQIHETNITITTSLSCNFPRKFICKLFLMLLPELLLVIMAFFLGGGGGRHSGHSLENKYNVYTLQGYNVCIFFMLLCVLTE